YPAEQRAGPERPGREAAESREGVSNVQGTVAARIEELVTYARTETGLDDFGGDSWREGLEVLVGSALEEARLNAIGEHMFHDSIVRTVQNRLRIEDRYHPHPYDT